MRVLPTAPLLGHSTQIPGNGLYVSSFDTEGNHIAMMQPTREIK